MSDRTVKIKLVADAKAYLDGIAQVQRETNAAAGSIEKRLERQRGYFDTMGKAALGAGAAITAGLALSVKAAIDWETAWAGVLKTVEGTPYELGLIEDGLRAMTAELPASHAEIAAVAEAAGQLGVETPNVVAFTRTMIDLGEATTLSSEEAATGLARFMNVMGTSQTEVNNLGSALVELGNNYATTEGEILAMAQRLSAAGGQIGMTEGDVLGLAAALSSVGIEADAGGSAFSKIMIDMARSVDEGGERLSMFAEVAGVSADYFAEAWRTSPGDALSLFVQGLANAEAQGTSTFEILNSLGLTEVRMTNALLSAANASDLFTEAMRSGNVAYSENTALAAEAEQRYATLESRMGIMRNQVVEAAIVLGEQLVPVVGFFVDSIADMAGGLAGLDGPFATVVAYAAALVAGLLLLGGTAVLTIPKIALFKAALDDLGITKAALKGKLGDLARSIGPAGAFGAALIAAAGLVYALVASFDSATASAELFTNAIETGGTGRDIATTMGTGIDVVTEGLRELSDIVDHLGRWDTGFLLWADFADTSNLNKLVNNLEQFDVALSSLPFDEAIRLFSEFRQESGFTDEAVNNIIKRMPALEARLYEAASALDVGISSMSELERETWLAAAATGYFYDENGNLIDSTDLAAAGVSELAVVTEDAASAAQSAYEEFANLNDLFFTAQDAMSSYEQTIDDITAKMTEGFTPAVTDGGAAFDLTEQSGRDAAAMMRDLVNDANDASDAMARNGASSQEVANYQEAAHKQIYETGRQMGLSEEAARAYADRLLAIPPEVFTEARLRADEAERQLDYLTRTRTVIVDVAVGSKPDFAHAPGGRGMSTALATGGRIPGYAPGYDDRIGFLRDGTVVGLGGGEYIMPTLMTDRYLPILEQMRRGTFPGYAGGGRLTNYGGGQMAMPTVNVAPASLEGMQVVVVDAFSGEQHMARMRQVADTRIAEVNSREQTRAGLGFKEGF